MRHVVGALLVGFLIGCPPLAIADEASSRAAAEELLVITEVEKKLGETFTMMKQMQTTQFEQLQENQSSSQVSDYAKTMIEPMMDMMAEALSWENMKDEYITVYVETYTEAELLGMVEFFKSPIGQRWIEKAPQLTKRLMEVGQRHSQEFMPKLMERFQFDLGRGSVMASETMAIGNSRALVSSLEMYRSVYRSYPDGWLDDMYTKADPDFGPPVFALDLQAVAQTVQNYQYRYTPLPTGCEEPNCTGYALSTTPVNESAGTRSFFTDQIGEIRHCTGAAGARATDPTINQTPIACQE